MNETPAADGGLRARRRALTEQDIEDAAFAAVEAHGFEATTMDRIADAAGVSVRTAFRYFPAKVDTLLVSAREVARLMGTALQSDRNPGTSLSAVEDSIAGSLAELAEARPAVVSRLKRLRALMLHDDRLRAEVAKSEGYLAGMETHLQAADSDPLETRLVAEIAAATLRAAFDSWADDADTHNELLRHYLTARELRDRIVARPR